jgi:hypothetical protein
MAEASMMETLARVKAGKTVLCPLCGHEMQHNGAAWFCRSGEGRDPGPCDLSQAFDAYCDPNEGRWSDDWQRTALAAVVLPGPKVVVELRVVRGFGGRDNLRVSGTCGVNDAEVPSLITRHGWTWQEWMPEEVKA